MANRRSRNSADDGNPPPPPRSSEATRHPVYHGIRCRSGKWVSEIREPNKSTRIWLGTYPTPEMAAAAYDVAAFALKGATYAILNFPDATQYYSNMLPQNPTSDDIRAAAASAAAARAPTAGRNYYNESSTGAGGSNSSSTGNVNTPADGELYMDDEAVFGMPNMITDMAEGMLLSPPRMAPTPPDFGDNSSSGGGGNLWDY